MNHYIIRLKYENVSEVKVWILYLYILNEEFVYCSSNVILHTYSQQSYGGNVSQNLDLGISYLLWYKT